jgi:hypothetical protein
VVSSGDAPVGAGQWRGHDEVQLDEKNLSA